MYQILEVFKYVNDTVTFSRDYNVTFCRDDKDTVMLCGDDILRGCV